MDVKKTLAALTLEEKASLCSGENFWMSKAVARLGLRAFMLTDGPHGLRKQATSGEAVGLHESVPATCFPSGAGLAATWNRALLEEVGVALGKETRAEDVGVVLGPAVNIKRSPLCGRNFEYLSEDPYLAGELAKHHVRGVQSQGVGASIKHFAANNQEKNRMAVDAIVDERTLREIYLPAFEVTVEESQPWTVMCAYNRINGTYCAQHRWLLTDLLKEEWGHTGLVVSDWGAVDDRVAALKAGMELEMPGNGGTTDRHLVEAVRAGELDEAVLDAALTRILELYARVEAGRRPAPGFDEAVHHALARRVAAESMVLLKNDGGILPLPRKGKLAFLGAFAETPRYQGGGSSHMRPTRLDGALAEARALLAGQAEVTYAPGYDLLGDAPDAARLAAAAALAKAADAAVVFIGLTDVYESEGFDRTHLGIPPAHVALLEAVVAAQPRTVVVLQNGSPIEMPWLGKVPAVLETYLGGQAGGGAAADVLFGVVSPSGKLPETFPVRLQDNPSYLNFPGDAHRVTYAEGLFVGYRHYDSADVAPLFPFGHGLSYTTFAYSGLTVDRPRLTDAETVTVRVRVKNTGARAGQEVVQLYVQDDAATVVRPVKELRGFEKVALAPGEEQEVAFTLGKRAFAFWDVGTHAWRVEPGAFTLHVGASSQDLRGSVKVEVTAAAAAPRRYDQNTLVADVVAHPVVGPRFAPMKAAFLRKMGNYPPGSAEYVMAEAVVSEMPLRNAVRMGRALTEAQLEVLLAVLNGERPAAALAALAG